MKLVTARQMQEIDRHTIDGGHVPALSLMENAGRAAAAEALRLLPQPPGARVEILCGKGNNGGDGLVVARLLAARGVRVHVHLTHPPRDLSPEAQANHRRLRRAGGVAVSLLPDSCPDPGPIDNPSQRPRQGALPGGDLAARLSQADLCIDALLGTGAARPLSARLAALANVLNRSSRRTLALDIPSGIDASSGQILGTAVWADVTVTFGLPKLGLAFFPGRERAGRSVVADIGFPAAVLDAVESSWTYVDATLSRGLLPRLEPTAHKYSRGTVLVLAGSTRFPGAAALATAAALRAGAGMVHLVVPASIRRLLQGLVREAIVHACPEGPDGVCDDSLHTLIAPLVERADALVIGPGLPPNTSWVGPVLREVALPAVVDADAILTVGHKPGPRVVTPHRGELARWLQRDVDEAGRVEAAAAAAAEHAVVVVCKGAPTVVVAPDGSKRVNGSGNVGLATAGSGDVLSGVLGSLLAQGLPAFDAATLAVYLHGLAADLATAQASRRSLVAGDLLGFIGQAYALLE